jgi:serine/threonine-protein kinase RsbW
MKSSDGFKKDRNELQNIFSFLEQFWTEESLDTKITSEIELAVEELFMNMVRYNPDNNSSVQLRIEKYDDRIEVEISDKEKVPFDITQSKDVDLDNYFEKQKSGGLGIHLVKQLMDEISFRHYNGTSTITITKFLSE